MRAVVRVVLMLLLGAVMGACQHGSSCVAEGSQVATPDGPRAIETLEVGDAVMARMPDGSISAARVTAKTSHRVHEHLRLVMDDGRVLRVTAEHPVATENGEFVHADELGLERGLMTRDGVTRVQEVRRESGGVEVFDLNVEPGETFFVEGVLVHNKSYPAPPSFEELSGTWLHVGGRDQPTFRMDVRKDGTFTMRDAWSGQIWEGRLPADENGTRLAFSVFRTSRPLRIDLSRGSGMNGLPPRMDVSITPGVITGEIVWSWGKQRRDALHLVHERVFRRVLESTRPPDIGSSGR